MQMEAQRSGKFAIGTVIFGGESLFVYYSLVDSYYSCFCRASRIQINIDVETESAKK